MVLTGEGVAAEFELRKSNCMSLGLLAASDVRPRLAAPLRQSSEAHKLGKTPNDFGGCKLLSR